MFGRFKSKIVKKQVLLLIDMAGQLGLNEKDTTLANEYLGYNEIELSFDLIINQVYEYDIKITKSFYLLIEDVARKLKLSVNEYDFLLQLLKDDAS